MRRMQGYVSDAYSESNLREIWDKSSLRDTSTKRMACNLPKCPIMKVEKLFHTEKDQNEMTTKYNTKYASKLDGHCWDS